MYGAVAATSCTDLIRAGQRASGGGHLSGQREGHDSCGARQGEGGGRKVWGKKPVPAAAAAAVIGVAGCLFAARGLRSDAYIVSSKWVPRVGVIGRGRRCCVDGRQASCHCQDNNQTLTRAAVVSLLTGLRLC